MAQRSVLFCDTCDQPELKVGSIIPTYFIGQGEELCFACATIKLQALYKVESPVAVSGQRKPLDDDISPETKAFDDRRREIAEEQGVAIYVVKPNSPVESGMVIEYGNPQSLRQVEIIEAVAGKEGEYFAKLA